MNYNNIYVFILIEKNIYFLYVEVMYKRLHCLNCGRKFTRVYDRRRHEKLVSCEKKEIYNDVEILVRLEKLEGVILELCECQKKMCVRVGALEKRNGGVKSKKSKKKWKGVGVGVGVGNIKQKKILEFL